MSTVLRETDLRYLRFQKGQLPRQILYPAVDLPPRAAPEMREHALETVCHIRHSSR